MGNRKNKCPCVQFPRLEEEEVEAIDIVPNEVENLRLQRIVARHQYKTN